MSLVDTLSGSLDLSGPVGGLGGLLAGPLSQLSAVVLPEGMGELHQGAGQVTPVDSAGLSQAVMAARAQVEPLLANIPGVDQVLGPITSALTLAETFASLDIQGQVGAILASARAELAGGAEEGALARMQRALQAVSQAPGAQSLGAVAESLLGLLGVRSPLNSLSSLGEVLPAAVGLAQALGGMTALQSVLAEGERVTAILARQGDAPGLAEGIQAVLDAFGEGETSLSGFITRELNAANPSLVEAMALSLDSAMTLVEGVLTELNASLGLGEATLVYLDVDRILAEVGLASTLVRTADLLPTKRLMTGVAERVSPLVRVDLSGIPTVNLGEFLEELRTRVAELVAPIAAFDAAAAISPLTSLLEQVEAFIATLTRELARVVEAVRSALHGIRDAIASLPLGEVAAAVRTALAPVREALTFLTEGLAAVEGALETAATATSGALTGVEGVLDGFKEQLDTLLAGAREAVAQVEPVLGQVAGEVAAFADLVKRASLKPCFDTATSAIDSAADVVGAIPFGLLPDSMKSEVDAAVKPIKDVDTEAVEAEIHGLLFDADGEFALRDELDAAVAEVQAQYDALVQKVRDLNPEQHLTELDARLQEVAEKIQEIAPSVSLEPVQEAIDQLKEAVAGLDPEAILAPVQQVFDEALAAIDRYSPVHLLEEARARVEEVRTKVLAELRFDQWKPVLDDVSTQARATLASLDPARLTPLLVDAVDQLRSASAGLPQGSLMGELGTLLMGLFSRPDLRLHPGAFPVVVGWVGGESGTEALTALTGRISAGVATASQGVRGLDLLGLSSRLEEKLGQVRGAITSSTAAAEDRGRLLEIVQRFDVRGSLVAMETRRSAYLIRLEASGGAMETLRRTGISEVDVASAGIRDAFSPLSFLADIPRRALARLGITVSELTLPAIVEAVFQEATPERIVAILEPVFTAIQGRVLAIVDAVLTPLKDGITQLESLFATFDLTPLVADVQGIVDEVKAQVSALSPATLLAEPLAAFTALREEVAGFDPLGPLLQILEGVRDAVARVLSRLDSKVLLETPLALYNEVLGALDSIDLQNVLKPVLDSLEDLAVQVDEGLASTLTAFEHLQDALPGGGGGSSSSASVGL